MATLKNTTINDTGFITIPSGTITQRPSPAANGMIRYNTDLGVTEYYASNNWLDITTGKPPIVTSGLVLHLDAGDGLSYPGSGNTWFDISGNGNTGTLTNGPTYNSGNGGSIAFDGTNDVVNGDVSAINRNDGQEITVSCWIKPSRTSGQYSVFCTNRSNNASIYNWIFYQHTTDGALGFHGDAQNKSSYIPTTNVWINATNTVDASGVSILYVNGVSKYTVTGYTYGNGTPSRLGIGADPGGQEPFQGNVSNIQIYNRALSATEIQQNFEALRGRYSATYPNPPGAPTITSVVPASTTSVTVAFTAPTTGGTPISYTAYSSGGQSASVTQSGSGTITITGLATSTYYTFYVVAFNGDGNSPNSNTVGCGTPIAFTATNSSYAIPASSGTGTYTIYAIGGGGGGGAWSGGARWYGAGGGSGRYSSASTSLTSGGAISVTIGAGGAGYTAGGTTSVVVSGIIVASVTGGSGAPSTGGTGGSGGSGGGCAPSDYNFTASQGGYNGSNGANGAASGGAGQLGVAYGSGTNTFIPPGGTGSYLSGANPWSGIFGIGAGAQAGSNQNGIVPGGGAGGATWGNSTKSGSSGLVIIYRTA